MNERIEVTAKELQQRPAEVFARAGDADIVVLNADGSVRMVIVRKLEALE